MLSLLVCALNEALGADWYLWKVSDYHVRWHDCGGHYCEALLPFQ